MQGAEQFAEADLPANAVANVAPADLATAIGLQQREVDFRVHGLFLVWAVRRDKLKVCDMWHDGDRIALFESVAWSLLASGILQDHVSPGNMR